MSLAEFSKILQKHIVNKVVKAAKSKLAVRSLDIESIRDTLGKASRHDAIISDQGFDLLLKQFSEIKTGENSVLVPVGSGKRSYKTFSQLTQSEKVIVEGAINKFTKINLNDFLKYITNAAGEVEYEGKLKTAKLSSNVSKETGANIYTIENIPQNQLINLFIDYMFANATLKPTENEKIFLLNNLQAGHTAGMFTLKMINTFGLLEVSGSDKFKISGHSKRSINPEDQDRAVNFMNGVISLLIEADRVSSNMPDELEVFATSIKRLGGRNTTASTELQLSWINRESGALVQGLGTRIYNLSKAAEDMSAYSKNKKQPEKVKSLLEGILALAKTLKKQYQENDKLTEEVRNKLISNVDAYVIDYINTPSSPIIIDDFIERLADTLIKGTSKPTSTHITKSPNIPISVFNNKELNKTIKSAISSTKLLVEKIKSVKKDKPNTSVSGRLRNTQGQFTSLASLQTLLNQALSEQIKQNMRKPALVNRTGRFAESAEVVKLSESRAGMITAFYTYMKNPYQTFEPGFRQGSEARNPKTLISKSIREIAAGIVGNRLRAVRL